MGQRLGQVQALTRGKILKVDYGQWVWVAVSVWLEIMGMLCLGLGSKAVMIETSRLQVKGRRGVLGIMTILANCRIWIVGRWLEGGGGREGAVGNIWWGTMISIAKSMQAPFIRKKLWIKVQKKISKNRKQRLLRKFLRQ